jgi:hypothetical protein
VNVPVTLDACPTCGWPPAEERVIENAKIAYPRFR